MELLKIPNVCPVCGQPTRIVVSPSGTKVLMCENPNCAAKRIYGFVHFCDREGMNIQGMSEKTIEKLVNKGWLKEFADFYHLGDTENRDLLDELAAEDGWGEKSISNLLQNIEKSRDVTFVNFIRAVGIPNIGKGQAKLLAPAIAKWMSENPPSETATIKNPTMLDGLCAMVYDGYDFEEIEGFGEVLAKSITDWADAELVEPLCRYMPETEITALLEEVHFTDKPEDYFMASGVSPLKDLTFVITGSVEKFKNRDELKAKIESLGGKATGSVTKKTSYLINNDVTSTSGKNQKAKELGIPIISEDDFLAMIQ